MSHIDDSLLAVVVHVSEKAVKNTRIHRAGREHIASNSPRI